MRYAKKELFVRGEPKPSLILEWVIYFLLQSKEYDACTELKCPKLTCVKEVLKLACEERLLAL
jgi:hypothetical protein